MFCSHDVCVAWAHLRLANLELVVHVGVKSVVSSSQSEQYNQDKAGYNYNETMFIFFFFGGGGGNRSLL